MKDHSFMKLVMLVWVCEMPLTNSRCLLLNSLHDMKENLNTADFVSKCSSFF